MFYKKKKNNKEHCGFWQRCQITVIGIPEDKFVLVVEFYASLISQFSEKSSVFTQIWASDHFFFQTHETRTNLPNSFYVHLFNWLFTLYITLLGSAGCCVCEGPSKCIANSEVTEFPLVDKLSRFLLLYSFSLVSCYKCRYQSAIK